MASNVVSSSLTTVGTITTGVWNGTAIAVANGGTGLTSLTSNVIYKGNGTGNLVASGLTDNGTLVSSSESIDATNKSYVTEIANGTAGTTVNKLAKLNTSGAAIIAATTDTDGEVGVVIGGAGTTGTAQIAVDGQASCVFDGATTAGDFVTISSTTAGDCHDSGTTRSSTLQTIGQVLTTNGAGGTYAMTVKTAPSAAADGAVTGTGTTNYVARWTSSTALGTGTLYDNGTSVGIGVTPDSVLHVSAGNIGSSTYGSHFLATGTDAASQEDGAFSEISVSPTSAPASAYLAVGLQGFAWGTSANINGNVNNTGILGVGAYGTAATGTIGILTGVTASAQNLSTVGTANTARSLYAYVVNNSTGTISNAYGVDVGSPTNSGTITKTYGVYISSQKVGTQTNTPYGIYQAGATDYNYFAGNVGMGTPSPNDMLDVYGGVAVGTSYAGATGVTAPTNGMIVQGNVGIGSTSPIVSLDLSQKSDAIALPTGTSGTRPTGVALVNGEIRYNSATPGVEAYVNGNWTALLGGTGGVLGVPNGGTGDSTLTQYSVLLGNGTGAIASVGPGATSGQALISQGASANPTFGTINLASSSIVTGTLPVGNGGTGAATLTGYVYGNGTSAMTASTTIPETALGALAANQVLGSLTAVAPSGLTVPSCSTTSSALMWTSGTGFSCNTAIVAPAGTLSGTTLASNVVSSSLTTVGTITTGVWNGTAIAVANGGTGLTSLTSNVIYKGNGTGNLVASGLTDNGTLVSSSESIDATNKSYVTEIANGTAGTTVNKLAKLNTSGAAIIAATTDTDGEVGVVIGGAGTTGTAQIAVDGQASCVFDGATTAGDFVTISTTTAGDCHDSGTTRSSTLQTIGRILTTNASGGTYAMTVQTAPSAAADGAVTGTGTTNYVARWTSSTALGTGALYDNGTNVGIGSTGPGSPLSISTSAISNISLQNTSDTTDTNSTWFLQDYYNTSPVAYDFRIANANGGFGTAGVIADFQKDASSNARIGLGALASTSAVISVGANLNTAASDGLVMTATELVAGSYSPIKAVALGVSSNSQRLFSGVGISTETFNVMSNGQAYFAGNIGIGSASPTYPLTITNGNGTYIDLQNTTDTTDTNANWYLGSTYSTSTLISDFRISNANAGFGTGGVIADFQKDSNGNPRIGFATLGTTTAAVNAAFNLNTLNSDGWVFTTTQLSTSNSFSPIKAIAASLSTNTQRLYSGVGISTETFNVMSNGQAYFASNVGIGSTSPIASLDLSQKSDAIALPTGTSGTRPTGAALVNGEIRYNSATPGVEAYVNGNWTALLGGAGGVLGVPNGGTGDSTLTQYSVLLGNGTGAIASVGPGATSGQALISQGASANPTFGTINLASSSIVTGTLPVGNGGTGAATLTGYVYGNGTSAMTASTTIPETALGALAANQVLGSLTAVAPSGLTVPSCSTTSSALMWTSGTGFSCNTAIVAPAGTLSGTTLASNVVSSSLTTVGTITTGVWNGTAIAVANGGTGLTSLTSNVIYKGNGTGNLVASGLTDNGTIVSSSESIDATNKSYVTEIANGTAGTTVNKLAKLNTSGAAIIAATADTDGEVGVVIGGAGTTGTAQIAVDGQASCVFDGATTAGDFVTISSTTAGDCHDSGTTRSSTLQTIGRILTTNASGGTYAMTVQTAPSAAADGAVTGTGTTNYVARWTSSTALGTGALYDNGTSAGIGTTSLQTNYSLTSNGGIYASSTAAAAAIYGTNSNASGYGVYGKMTGANNTGAAGYFTNTDTSSSVNYGVYAISVGTGSGAAVYGECDNANCTGIKAVSTNGSALTATSSGGTAPTVAMYGNQSPTNYGNPPILYAFQNSAGSTYPVTGIYADINQNTAGGTIAISGVAGAGGGNFTVGVQGYSNSTGGAGVYGTLYTGSGNTGNAGSFANQDTTGVNAGVFATTASTNAAKGIYGTETGASNTGYAVYGANTGGGAVANYGGYFTTNATGAGFGLYASETGASNTGYAGYFTNSSTTGWSIYSAAGRNYFNGSLGIGSTSPVASLDLSQNSDAIALPTGTSGTRPTGAALVNGEIRYNSATPGVEAYVNGNWTALLGGAGGVLGVPNGGTGAATLTGYVYGNGTSAMTASTTIPETALGALAANQVLGSLTAVAPSGLTVPSCSTTSSALMWTSGTGFSCNTAIVAPAGTLSGTTLASNVVSSSLTTVGTITTGVWNGTAIAVANGGTGLTSLTSNVIYKGNGTGNLVASGLTDNGTLVSSSESIDATNKSYVTEIANGTAGTTVNKLAKLNTSGAAIIAATTDTDGEVGVVIGGAGTTGTAQIAVDGQASCVFDGATTAGDFVTISTTTAGDCHDSGTTRSSTLQTIGRILTTNASGGTYAMTVQTAPSAAADGAVTGTGTTNYVARWTSSTALGTGALYDNGTNVGIGSTGPGSPLSISTSAISNISLQNTSDTTDTNSTWFLQDYYNTSPVAYDFRIANANGGFGTGGVIADFQKDASGNARIGLNALASTSAVISVGASLNAAASDGLVMTATELVAGSYSPIKAIAASLSTNTQRLYSGVGISTETFNVMSNGQAYFASNVGIGSTSPIASLDLSQKSDAIALPTGTSGTRPTGVALVNGEIRYNSATPGVEAYVNGNWTALLGGTGGVLGVPNGGTGDSTLTQYSVLLGNGTGAIASVGPGATSGQALISQGASANPTFGTINLASSSIVTGTLPVGNGGTGAATLTGYVYGNGTSAMTASTTIPETALGALAANQVLGSLTAVAPSGLTVPSCSTTSSALMWTSGTGFSCNTAIVAPAGTLSGTTLASNVVSSSLTTVGTITTGVWNGTAIAVANGGTGLTSLTSNVIYKGNGTGNLVASGLTDNGTLVSSSESIDATNKSYVTEIANGTAGTTVNKLAKLNTSGAAIIAATTDTDGEVGVVIGGAGTTGTAQIAVDGQASCVFDGATTAGDFVTISTTTAGDCHDSGTTRSSTLQTIGRILTTNASGGTYAMTVQTAPSAAADGAITGSGTTNYLAKFNSGTTIGSSLIIDTGTSVGINVASPVSVFQVAGTSANGSGVVFSPTIGTSGLSQTGINLTPTFTPSAGTVTQILGQYTVPQISASSSNVTDYLGSYSQLTDAATYTGTLALGVSFFAANPSLGSSTPITTYAAFDSGVITNGTGITTGTATNYGVLLNTITAAAAGGTLKNYGIDLTIPSGITTSGTQTNYGLYITGNAPAPTGGTETSYSIYNVSTAPSYFAGTIGLGSTAPLVSLDISQNSDAIALPVGTNGNRPTGSALTNGEIRYNSSTPGIEAYVNSTWTALGTSAGTGSTGYIARWIGTTTIGTGSIYDSSTQVGIGTAAPSNLLNIYGPTPNFQLDNTGATTSKDDIQLVTLSNGSNLGISGNLGWQIDARSNTYTTTAQQNDLQFLYWNGTTFKSIAYLAHGGGFGIANTSPGYPLDVTGSIRTTQAILNSSSVPTASGCTVSTGSNNNSGQFTLSATTACTLTFANAYPNYAFCTVTPASAYTGTYYISATSKSAFTLTESTSASTIYNYTCGGN